MHSRFFLLSGSLLVASSVAATAAAEPPHGEPPAKVEAPKAPSARPVTKLPAAPSAHAAPAATHAAPPAAATPPRTPALSLKTAPKPIVEKPAPGQLHLEPESGDPGIHIHATGDRIIVKGTSNGPAVKYSEGIFFENGKRVRPVDYTVARGVSFQIDHEKMPDFSADPDYTRKNAWYFAHLASTSTEKGQPAKVVAQHLAESLNKGGAFKATVEQLDDGSAEIRLKKL